MKNPKTLLACFGLAACICLYAQGDFKPGYIVSLDQDTIYGQIKVNSESRNARTCVFRTGTDAATTEYAPGEISAYRFTNGKYYISATVEDEGEQKQLFLEYLVNGMADLYYLRKDNTEVYYIWKDGENALAITEIRMLKAAFSDCYEIQASLDRASLTHSSLISMTEKYHDYVCDGEVCINYTKEASQTRLKVGPVVGYSMNWLRIRGDLLYDLLEFETGNAPVFGILVDLGFSRLGDRLSFQAGAGFSKLHFTGFGERDTYGGDYFTYDAFLESSFLTFQLGSRYAFSTNRVRPSLGGGFEFAKFIKPDYYYVQNKYSGDLVFTETWAQNPVDNPLFGAYLQAGFDVKLTNRLVLVSFIKGGFLTSNANTLAGGTGGQIRLRPDMLPVSVHLGILF